MRNLMIVAALGMMLVTVGCKSDNNTEAEASKSASDPKMMSADACSMCPGVQTMTASGACSSCGMKPK